MADTGTETRSNALRQISADAPRYSGYTSLNTGRREIRVLEIHASLHCRLRTVSLDDQPKYSALSYYWGPPGATAAITVDGETLHIRKTVYQFLETLYQVRGSTTVWLDLICINQRDVSEQSTQVALMGEIYSQAEQVYAWLGQGEPDPQYALSYVNCSDDGRKAYKTDSVLDGTAQLFTHPYFTRVWIIQECLLNDNLIIMSGDRLADFDKMVQAYTPLEPEAEGKLRMSLQNSSAAWKNMADIVGERENLRRGARKPLLELVESFADRECQDPRDKFYGFRALAYDGSRLHVDYRNEPIDILLQVISNSNWNCFLDMARCYKDPLSHSSVVRKFDWDFTVKSGPPFGTDFKFLRKNLAGTVHQLCEELGIPRLGSVQGLRQFASDWLVHRVRLIPPPGSLAQIKGFFSDGASWHSALKPLIPIFDAHIHSVCISFGHSLLVAVDNRNGAVVAGVSGNPHITWQPPGLEPNAGALTQGADLQLMLSRMAKRHVWPCRVTLGLHTSRLFLVALSSLDRYMFSSYSEIMQLLTNHDNPQDDKPIGKCTCSMPHGLSSPEPPPWTVP